MSENAFGFDFEEDDAEQIGGGDLVSQLRNQLRQAKKVNRELNDRVTEMSTQVTDLTKQLGSTKLTELLKAKGAKPALAKFMGDVEPSEEAVTAWLSENGELFGYDPTKAQSEAAEDAATTQTQQSAGQQQALPPEMEAILATMAQVQNQEATAAPGLQPGEEKNLDFISRVGQNAHSFTDVESALRQAGFFNTPG